MDERPEETVGERLRRLRRERGLSQRELASPGVSYAYISRIEAGTRQPSVKALRKLARKLGVTAEFLETGSDVRDEELRELRLAQAELELRLSGEPDAARAALDELLAEAEAAGDVASARRARISLGLAAFETGHVAEAVTLLERAVADTDVSPGLRPDVYATLGRALAMQGRAQDAVELFEHALRQVEGESPSDVPARVRFATYLSFALTDLGELRRAEVVLRDVLNDLDTFVDPYTQVRVHWSLGRLAGAQGRPSDALEHLRRAIVLLEATEDTVHLAKANIACAWSLIENERAEEAGPYLEAAETLLGAKPAPADLAQLRTEQARRAVALGDSAGAAAYAREAIDVIGDTFPEEQGTAWLALADALALADDTAGAGDAYRRSVEAYGRAGRPHEQARAYRSLGRLLRAEGREAEALDALEKAADLAARQPSDARVEA
ncbi:MAG: tetratricopeptide repeat protein [Pseudomonadota bacterium]